ncbi:DNA repair protein RadC [Wolbachia endosymbiont of Carposina sasakii]|uniref:JAB domain-containing protein n=1 Tax=Wolbachia endosymbiont of Carposina sasakii TaxID=2591635 RepID=UPI001144C4CB|nr:DNA repair protein RadC [Wolbachia endosymbiont of Carposina sasakii]QDH18958.1 DNA repair protein RadC [Wolbachia endosymbiont of Carposina sasakii]
MNNSERKEKLETRILSSRGRSLLDHELLERTLSECEEGREVAKKLIELFSSLGRVINADLHELKNVTGMNDGAIASIFCLKEIFDRILKGKLKKLSILDNREELLKYFKTAIGQSRKESLRVIYLDRSGHLIYEYIQDCGTIDRVPLYVREIIKQGLLIDASSIAISHNHPSGDTEPSKEDEDNTLTLAATCENVGMKLIDHIIVTQKSHFSFYDSGLL